MAGSPDLDVTTKGGATLVICRVGCPQDDVIAALQERDLWPRKQADTGRRASHAPVTVSALAREKGLPEGFLRRLGLCDEPGGQAVLIPYHDADGDVMVTRRRLTLAGKNKTLQPSGVPLRPYGLDRLADWQGRSTLLLVEGESDCWAGWFHDVAVLGLPGSSSGGCLERAHVSSFATLIICQEPDAGGTTFTQKIADRLHTLGFAGNLVVARLAINGARIKDLADLHLAVGGDPESFRAAIEDLDLAEVQIALGHEDVPPEASATSETVSRPGRRPCTDLGNAERLMDRFGADLRYAALLGDWLVWDGRRWAVDSARRVVTLARDTVRAIYAEASEAETKEARRELSGWAHRSESAARIEAMISLARAFLPIDPGDLDRNPWLLNTRTGTIDLRDGRMKPHDRADRITRLIDVEYDRAAPRSRWERFLEDVLPSEDVRAFLKRAAGYSATGSARERKLIITYGSGQNGKGVFLQAMRQLLGDYGVRTPSETFLARKYDGVPNDIAQLRGARFVFASETNEGRRLGEATIKDLTGGEDISARFMRGEWFSFAPTFTPWLATNHRPEIRGTDHAIWDRIALVPFTVRIPEQQQDRALSEKLGRELSGILAWVIEGAAEWYRDGLNPPADVRAATDGYRREMDTLGDFLEEWCILDPQAWVLAGGLYDRYKAWADGSGERVLSQKALGARLSERGFMPSRLGPKQVRTWSGLRLATDADGSIDGSDRSDTKIGIASHFPVHEALIPKHVSDLSDPSEDVSEDDDDQIPGWAR